MIITAPITDYIPASILTTHGDLVERGVAIPERLAAAVADLYLKSQGAGTTPIYEALRLRDTGIYLNSFTRNAGGAMPITGVGFEASLYIFLASDNQQANMNWSVSFCNAAFQAVLYQYDTGTEAWLDTDNCIYIRRAVGNSLRAALSAIGADGFTLDWTIVGACSLKFAVLGLP